MKCRVVILLIAFFTAFGVPLCDAQEAVPREQPPVSTKAQSRAGRKDDVNAIGHRNVGKRGFGNWYSFDTDISIGKEYSALIEADLTLVKDPAVTEYVNRIGQNLARNSDAPMPFTIKVIDSDEINAFSLPGGFLYVNYGLILACENEAELAGVMAHEIAHVAARHATRQMTRANIFNIISLPLSFAGGGAALGAVRMIAGVAMPMGMMRFSRGFEAEADYLGLQYLYVAGYDPQGFISLLERTASIHEGRGKKTKTGSLEELFSTHPKTAGRIKKGQEEIAKILPPREIHVVDTSDFVEVQAHLRQIDIAHYAGETKPGEPRLRRPTSSPQANASAGEEAPPTLKRRDE